ncbi:MAG: hypothetical protein FE78DRAFT_90849 [Acidomyces sp. 'richmondensis']|nr:MAG: hypothetical protein FE78DRAFT_90849 [Acidomyces sp. 'richmondensis']
MALVASISSIGSLASEAPTQCLAAGGGFGISHKTTDRACLPIILVPGTIPTMACRLRLALNKAGAWRRGGLSEPPVLAVSNSESILLKISEPLQYESTRLSGSSHAGLKNSY